MVFNSIHSMVSHKRHYCKLRFTCKCEADTCSRLDNCSSAPEVLACSSCGQEFEDPWDLMEHVQVRCHVPRVRWHVICYPVTGCSHPQHLPAM